MSNEAPQRPDITPDEATDLIVGNYSLSEVAEANGNDREQVRQEVRDEFEHFFVLAQAMGVTSDKIRNTMDLFMQKNPVGTDLDERYGAGMAGIFDEMEEAIPVPANADPSVWKELRETLDSGLCMKNVALQRLIVLKRFATIMEVCALTAEEQQAALNHAKQRTSMNGPNNYGQLEKAFRQAAGIIKMGGLNELKRFERDLFDN